MLTIEHREIIDTELGLWRALQRTLQAAGEQRAGEARLVDTRVPYFAHLRLETERRSRDLLLGSHTLIDAKAEVTLVDWRTAPLAAVLFNYEEGESYEEEINGRTVAGKVVCKRLVSFEEGEPVRIDTPAVSLQRRADGGWRAAGPEQPARLTGGHGGGLPRRIVEADAAGRRIPVVTDLLDAQQRALVEHDASRPLLILGGAGCGKTTVALHRLARLHHSDPRRFAQKSIVVVVPEQGLKRLTSAILEQLRLPEAGVFTFDEWAAMQARRLFRDLPRRECAQPPARVVKLKRHPALRALLPELVVRQGIAAASRLDRGLTTGKALAERMQHLEAPSLRERLELLEQHALALKSRCHRDRVRHAFGEEYRRLHRARRDLLELFGDRELLMQAVHRSGGELGEAAVEDAIRHTRVQFSQTSEQELAHVNPEARATLDGRSLDDGTPQEDAQTLDVEDYAVCLELLRLKTGEAATPYGKPMLYTHMLLDEAQELAPIELGVLGRALRRRGTLTVCGDRSQQIDPTACFAGWERALGELGLEGLAPVHLSTSYRCTEPVTRFAHEVLGPLAPPEAPVSTRSGVPVATSCYATEAHATYYLVQALSDLTRREPSATVAVVTRGRDGARRLHAALQRSLPVRLVIDGDFTFAPGIDITPVSQVKGLEFDVVVAADASFAHYGADPESRRSLHVACTRAIEQLWVVSVARPSPILPVFTAPAAGGDARMAAAPLLARTS